MTNRFVIMALDAIEFAHVADATDHLREAVHINHVKDGKPSVFPSARLETRANEKFFVIMPAAGYTLSIRKRDDGERAATRFCSDAENTGFMVDSFQYLIYHRNDNPLFQAPCESL